MNFFERQDKARSYSSRLNVLFIVAFIFIFALIHVAVTPLWWAALPEIFGTGTDESDPTFVESLFHPLAILADLIVISLVVFGAKAYKSNSLSAMGVDGIARSLGGTPVRRGSLNPWERRLYNVVEEMAIASGSPIPAVYIMNDEKGINACAFGDGPENSGICVTRGAIDALTRDELQGVIGHEFSHIVNSDVKINVRMIGVLFGLECIALAAYCVMRVAFSARPRDKEGGAIVAIGLIALVVMIVGYVGVFFGNLIRLAVSRQREYLADASSVQFTRNPLGLANALKKIGGYPTGSQVKGSASTETAHMFFGSIFKKGWAQKLCMTHPPIEDRIRAVDPSFNGKIPYFTFSKEWTDDEEPLFTSNFSPGTSNAVPTAVQPREVYGDWIDRVKKQGAPIQSEEVKARPIEKLLEKIPDKIYEALDEPVGTRAVVYAMLVSNSREALERSRKTLVKYESGDLATQTGRAFSLVSGLTASTRLAITRMAIATLKEMQIVDYRAFRAVVVDLCNADNRVDLFEYAVLASLIRELDMHFGLSAPPKSFIDQTARVKGHIETVLTMLAREGEMKRGDAFLAYQKGCETIGLDSKQMVDHCSLASFTASLNVLWQTTVPIKERVLQACYKCVAYDGVVTEDEATIISAITAALGVPAPIWTDWAQ